jgi:hypothetical protein
MVRPSVVVKDGMDGQRLARSFSRSAATERLVNAILVVIISELLQLSPQVDGVPDQHVVKKLLSYHPNQPFHKRMGPPNSPRRPLGIPTFEDKVAQRAIVMVLEAVYEQDFLPCSFGFRRWSGY